MTTTEITSRIADRNEQHQADVALLGIDRSIALRFGNTDEMIAAAAAREAAYAADIRTLLAA
jgi:hypothetical protein